MKKLLSVFVVLCGLSFIGIEAEAKRLGGGKSMGTQRNMTQQQAAPKAPAQQQQSQQAAGTPAPQQPAAATGNKWLGPLAGLAMGAGLMALFMNNGIAGALAGLLLAAAIAGVLMLVFRALRGKTANAPLQYAGSGNQGGNLPQTLPAGGAAAAHSVAAATATMTQRWPADFNATEFLRHARLNFVRLQEAHDARDSAALADFLAADLLAEVQAQWQTEGSTISKTDVVTLESEVLEVVSEGLLYVASVRFSGLIREDGAAEPQPFAEIWHLEKPMRGSTGWLVSGIQQV